MKPLCTLSRWLAASLLGTIAMAEVPPLIGYQGRVAVGAVNFEGTGVFRFALVNGPGTATYWSNDGTSTAGSAPAAGVPLVVSKGLYSVLLGQGELPNMTPLPSSVFANSDVRLRVWFDDGANGPRLLTPDQRIVAVGYAMQADTAATVPDGAITTVKFAHGSVGNAQLGAGAVMPGQLAAGAAVANLNAGGQSGVGQGGIILSADFASASLAAAGYVKVGPVDLGDVWQQRAGAGIPSRDGHTAVWTGSEMIVWGGLDYTNATIYDTGARYNPATDVWTLLTATAPPAPRFRHTAVWTGSEMIVWGGQDSNGPRNDGGRYQLSANT